MKFANLDELPSYERFSASASSAELELPLVTITPMLGGGTKTRVPDDVDIVRVPSIRGQLRFWWRALFAGRHATSEALYGAEREIWGGIGSKPSDVAASKVRLSMHVTRITEIDASDVGLQQPDAYALWTARGTRLADPAPRRMPGVELTLVVRCRREDLVDVQAALRAWLLFGGVGGRTRRGCGSLALATPEARRDWLPLDMKAPTLQSWLRAHPAHLSPITSLHQAQFCLGAPQREAPAAWHPAIAWLRDFRQGAGAAIDTAFSGAHARQRPSLAMGSAGRPGRSRWPEPDKIRHRFGPRSFDHAPLPGHGSAPHWPRAELGLPVEVRFQTRDRTGQPFSPRPPQDVKLGWTTNVPGPRDHTVEAHDRLASPLVIKPVQLRDGRFAPLALWLTRQLPLTAQAGIHRDKDTLFVDSLAPPGLMLPAGDTHLFAPLGGKSTLREAFMDWVGAKSGVTGGAL